jgi:4-diphosphocytidyl-2-C-methyl-D-erythritol kinase
MMRVPAPAKLNLFLHVGDKRQDGFHVLESLVVFVEEADILTIEPATKLSLEIVGPFASALRDVSDNFVLRAARALDATLGAAITLEKNLPVAAGIGGGSADAAAALRGLNLFWDLDRTPDALNEIAAQIGSDVPACVLSQPVWMEGRGEVVFPTRPIPAFELVLANPNIALPTASVFASLNVRKGVGAMSPPEEEIESSWGFVS